MLLLTQVRAAPARLHGSQRHELRRARQRGRRLVRQPSLLIPYRDFRMCCPGLPRVLALVSYQNGHMFCLCLASPRRCDRDPCVRQHVLAEPCHVNASCHHAALPGTYERLLVVRPACRNYVPGLPHVLPEDNHERWPLFRTRMTSSWFCTLAQAVEQQFHNMSQQCELGYDGRLRCGSHYYTRHVFRYTFRYARVGLSFPPNSVPGLPHVIPIEWMQALISYQD